MPEVFAIKTQEDHISSNILEEITRPDSNIHINFHIDFLRKRELFVISSPATSLDGTHGNRRVGWQQYDLDQSTITLVCKHYPSL